MRGGDETRRRLLEAAERLFAERGFRATSVRAVTTRAGANLAAVNYHFGSKDAMIRELFRRRLEPLNARRLRLLEAAGPSPRLEAVMRCFLTPTWELWGRNPHFIRMAGRLHMEPDRSLLRWFIGQFGEVAERFGKALRRLRPTAAPDELFWRMHFVVGAMIHTWSGAEGLRILSRGRCRLGDGRRALELLTDFCCAGMRP